MSDEYDYLYWCDGRLEVLFADESSYRCVACGWIGWPRTIVNHTTGVIERFLPHRKDEPKYPSFKRRG